MRGRLPRYELLEDIGPATLTVNVRLMVAGYRLDTARYLAALEAFRTEVAASIVRDAVPSEEGDGE